MIGLVSVLALCAAVACGGHEPSTSGIQPARRVGSLDDAERATLCDWTNGLLGGYDHETVCGPTLSRTSDSSQQECTARLSRFTGCDQTVRDYEICVRGIAATICELNPGGEGPECSAYDTCIGM